MKKNDGAEFINATNGINTAKKVLEATYFTNVVHHMTKLEETLGDRKSPTRQNCYYPTMIKFSLRKFLDPVHDPDHHQT